MKRLLDGGGNVDIQDDEGRSHLMRVSALGALQLVEQLLTASAAIDLPDNNSFTALYIMENVLLGFSKF